MCAVRTSGDGPARRPSGGCAGTLARCCPLPVIRAAGEVLHAQLAVIVTEQLAELGARTDRWAEAERVAFGQQPTPDRDPELIALLAKVRDAIAADPIAGPEQLVHADLAGNVLLDAAGAPVVIDVAPAWRPVQWADAVCVLDAVLWLDASGAVLRPWTQGAPRTAMLHAIMFRLLSDDPPDLDAYADVLTSIASGGV